MYVRNMKKNKREKISRNEEKGSVHDVSRVGDALVRM